MCIVSWASVASVQIQVVDFAGEPVSDAIIAIDSKSQQSAVNNTLAVMDQVDMTFQPHVLLVQKGQAVAFPNNDNIRHHVYSFSKAKTFELKLFRGLHSEQIVMEQAGIVELGCNIHDNMLGFIYVDDTNTAVKTNAQGMAVLPSRSQMQVNIWHPALAIGIDKREERVLEQGKGLQVIKINLNPPAAPETKRSFKRRFNAPSSPSAGSGGGS
ncbi:methylamine utilization protein [Glaciecola siphonariae]|uniref:Methylamine utilization protein n=1 Tax=Glaciecola siphonariae TaxID=521012 RepID=A0ABV9M2R9_9ALTE